MLSEESVRALRHFVECPRDGVTLVLEIARQVGRELRHVRLDELERRDIGLWRAGRAVSRARRLRGKPAPHLERALALGNAHERRRPGPQARGRPERACYPRSDLVRSSSTMEPDS